jgi:hypothetical protein
MERVYLSEHGTLVSQTESFARVPSAPAAYSTRNASIADDVPAVARKRYVPGVNG